jgi:hypothetical protein
MSDCSLIRNSEEELFAMGDKLSDSLASQTLTDDS